jgi:hypothetical protein
MKNLVLSSLLLIALVSCSVEYYPTSINEPVFKNKGEFEATINGGTNGADLQFACSPVNHFGIITTGSFSDRSSKIDSTDFENYHKHLFGEFGAGYFVNFSKNMVFEVFGGYGYGRMEGMYKSGPFYDISSVHYSKVFIQPFIGFSNNIFEGGFANRISGINMTMLEDNSTQFGLFYEPAFVSKLGYKYVKFFAELGLCIPINVEDFNFHYAPVMFSVGLNLSIGGYGSVKK